jgi:hypothetical protein
MLCAVIDQLKVKFEPVMGYGPYTDERHLHGNHDDGKTQPNLSYTLALIHQLSALNCCALSCSF